MKGVAGAGMLKDTGTMTTDKFLVMLTNLLCYTGVYSEYLKSILTEGRLPALNNSGDMESMIDTVNDSPEFARRAGFETRVRHVKHVNVRDSNGGDLQPLLCTG